MCIKVDNRIECIKCGYPYSEAMFPDRSKTPLSCKATQEEINGHKEVCINNKDILSVVKKIT
jgi:hypothetical protein